MMRTMLRSEREASGSFLKKRTKKLLSVLAVALIAQAAPAHAGCDDYPIIVWQDQTPARAAGLKRLGVDAQRVFGVRGPLTTGEVANLTAPPKAAGWSFYLENIATDFYAAYHRYQPDHPVTWAFDQARALPRDDPAAFLRTPSLSDPHALAAIEARLATHARLFAPYHPLFYNLGDETGIADLAAAWDFDFSPASLEGMRVWLRKRYGSLAALNTQWGSHFASWAEVMPATTDAAIHGPADNFSAWSDFKAWMDTAFARAVRAGTKAIHSADPNALSGLEGTQIPGWGGYDYTKLASAVDVMEMYDAGNNVEIAHALNPRLRILTTTTPTTLAAAPAEQARLWHELLLGNRGLIIWDEAGVLVTDDGTPTPLGQSVGTLFHEFHDGIATQLAATPPAPSQVGILYSPPSFRIAWLLDRRADADRGQDWRTRDSEIEGQDSPLRAAMRAAATTLTHHGIPARWISPAMLADGVLRKGIRVLLLPHTIALSPADITAITAFTHHGGLVLADTPPALFDAHGRRRPTPALTGQVHITPGWQDLPDQLTQAGITPAVSLTHPDGTQVQDIDIRAHRHGPTNILTLQRDMDPPGTTGEDIVLTLPNPAKITDLRQHQSLGQTNQIRLHVGAAQPVIVGWAGEATPVNSVTQK